MISLLQPEAYSETSGTSTMEFFAKIVNGFQLLTIFAKSSLLDVRLGSEYASDSYYFELINKSEIYFADWNILCMLTLYCLMSKTNLRLSSACLFKFV